MPKSILEQKGYYPYKINSVKNFQLLDSGTNRGLKNGKPFKEWVDKHVSDKIAYVKRHLIPIDEKIWTEDSFEDFIEKRSSLIIDKIKKYV